MERRLQRYALCLLCCVWPYFAVVAFVGPCGSVGFQRRANTRTESALLTQQWTSQPAEFEYRELQIQLRALQDDRRTGVSASAIESWKRQELEGYIRRIVRERQRAGVSLHKRMLEKLPLTSWQLVFSTKSNALVGLSVPYGVDVVLDFQDAKTFQYHLIFTQTLGLKRLTTNCSYSIDPFTYRPGGVLSYRFENASFDVFQWRGLGSFLLNRFLQGRSGEIPTIYFDDRIWIEHGLEDSVEYFNVYMKD